jgi:hypothetical protein
MRSHAEAGLVAAQAIVDAGLHVGVLMVHVVILALGVISRKHRALPPVPAVTKRNNSAGWSHCVPRSPRSRGTSDHRVRPLRHAIHPFVGVMENNPSSASLAGGIALLDRALEVPS